jgi:hypothetical protein
MKAPRQLQNDRNFSTTNIVNKTTMKTILAIALAVTAFITPAAAQTSAPFDGKWEGTFTLNRPDGAPAEPRPIVFNLIQKGKELSGTAGPADQQEKVVGTVAAGKATFDVQLPNGSPFKFSLSIVKGHLVGDMSRDVNGTVRQAKVDATKAAKAK